MPGRRRPPRGSCPRAGEPSDGQGAGVSGRIPPFGLALIGLGLC